MKCLYEMTVSGNLTISEDVSFCRIYCLSLMNIYLQHRNMTTVKKVVLQGVVGIACSILMIMHGYMKCELLG